MKSLDIDKIFSSFEDPSDDSVVVFNLTHQVIQSFIEYQVLHVRSIFKYGSRYLKKYSEVRQLIFESIYNHLICIRIDEVEEASDYVINGTYLTDVIIELLLFFESIQKYEECTVLYEYYLKSLTVTKK